MLLISSLSSSGTILIHPLQLQCQINTLKRDVTERTQHNTRLSADIVALERSTALLNADIANLQNQAARADALDRELHQTKWRVTCLEKELQDATADFKFRLAQAQQASAMNAAMNMYNSSNQTNHINNSAPMPPQRPSAAAMPTYQPAYHLPAPYVPPTAPPAYNIPYTVAPGSSSSSTMNLTNNYQNQNSNYIPSSAKGGPGVYPGSAPSLAALAASTGFGGAHNETHAYHNNSSSSNSSSSLGRPPSPPRRAASAARNGLGGSQQLQQGHQGAVVDSTTSAPFGTASKSPFANEVTSAQINHVFDELDRRLTSLMTEKTALQDESERFENVFHFFFRYFFSCVV